MIENLRQYAEAVETGQVPSDFTMVSRREFLRTGAALIGAGAGVGSFQAPGAPGTVFPSEFLPTRTTPTANQAGIAATATRAQSWRSLSR